MSNKKYAVVKRVNLSGISDGWDDTCYAYIAPATYEDQKALTAKDVNSLTEEQKIDYQAEVVSSHFISGKIRVFDGAEFEEADMTVSDTNASAELNDRLYAAIMGFELDPKDIRKVVQESALQASGKNDTETTSSTESAEQ